MKKNFSKILLCAFALCTCVFSLSFGIYAIMSAQMNMSVTVGYLAYNCSANVSTVITGASIEAEGEIADITLETVEVNGKNKQTASMDLGTFYFTTTGTKNALGKPFPVKIWFTIENTSEFDICVEVTLPTITDVEVVADKTSHVIGAGQSDTIMVTFTVTNVSTTALETGFTASNLNLTFKKFLKTKADIPVYKDSTVTHFENHPYYIKFGNYFGSSDIYWLVGGTVDSNGQMVALTQEDKIQLDTGKFALDKDYYLICARLLYANSSRNYILIQNNFYYGYASSANCYLLEYPSISNVTDYSLSTIRQYLIGHTVKTGGIKDEATATMIPDTSAADSVPLCSLYGFDSDIYALIQKRSLASIYKTLGYGNTELSIPTELADNLSKNEADAFWIPTEADINVLGDDIYTYDSADSITNYFVFTNQSASTPQKFAYYTSNGKMGAYLSNEKNYCFRLAFIL